MWPLDLFLCLSIWLKFQRGDVLAEGGWQRLGVEEELWLGSWICVKCECDDMMWELECGCLDLTSRGLADTQSDPGNLVLLLNKHGDPSMKWGLREYFYSTHLHLHQERDSFVSQEVEGIGLPFVNLCRQDLDSHCGGSSFFWNESQGSMYLSSLTPWLNTQFIHQVF